MGGPLLRWKRDSWFVHDLYPSDIALMERSSLEQAVRQSAQSAYLGKGVVLARVLTRYKMFVHTDDVGFACHVMMDGFWESWISLFFARMIKPGMRVIDVGANYGYYTLLFADIVTAAGTVVAVEPNPRAVELLQRSIDLNGFAAQTRVVEAALGACEGGMGQLLVPVGEPKNAHLTDEPGGSGALYTVSTTTLDQVAEGLDRVDFIKIDAEGGEEAILSGMEAIIRRDRPALVLEFNARRCRDPAGLIAGLLKTYGEMNVIGYDGYARPVDAEVLLAERVGEDWMLYFGPITSPAPETTDDPPSTI